MAEKNNPDRKLKKTIQNHFAKTHYIKIYFTEECPEELT